MIQSPLTTYRDRDLYFEASFSLATLKKAGLPAATYSECALGADAFAGWWLDPMSKDFGPNGEEVGDASGERNSLMLTYHIQQGALAWLAQRLHRLAVFIGYGLRT